MATQPTPVPALEDTYAILCGDINAANVAKIVTGVTALSSSGTCRTLHLLWHSWGGFVGDAIFVYNLFRNIPLDIVVYNAGHVASAGVTAFLGARRRKATRNSLFMIHKATHNPGNSGVSRLKAMSDGLSLEDARIEEILRTNLILPEETWTKAAHHDVYLTGEEALACGLVDEIAEFSPPPGTKVRNALG